MSSHGLLVGDKALRPETTDGVYLGSTLGWLRVFGFRWTTSFHQLSDTQYKDKHKKGEPLYEGHSLYERRRYDKSARTWSSCSTRVCVRPQ